MKKSFILFVALLFAAMLHAQELYIKTFGNKKDEPLLFLHGGPGYNCAAFEATTAQKLADKGFFVICYDRRGEGRSLETQAQFTFAEASTDILSIYKQFKLKQATLLGHSFGGIVATKFAEKNAKKVKNIVLIGAPVALQETFRYIRETCKKIYTDSSATMKLNMLKMAEKLDTASLEYASFCFQNAMNNGFYSPKNPDAEAQQIREQFKQNTDLFPLASQMTIPPVANFWKNERYTTLNLSSNISQLVAANIPVWGLYGKDDGLYSAQQISALQAIIGEEHLLYLDNCSHNVFMDKQTDFINALAKWIKQQ